MTNDAGDHNERLAALFKSEHARLLALLRRRVPAGIDAEDLLQDVFYELIESDRALLPIAHAGAWMMQVARHRLIDLFRRPRRTVALDERRGALEDLLPSPEAGPDGLFARRILATELEQAFAELPPSQREVFLAHEVDGRSFAEISAATGVSVNTLLSRKHYAVQRLRRRLRRIHDEIAREGSRS